MTSYRDELEELRFSPEEKVELTRRLKAGRTETKRRMRLPYRGLVAGVAVVSLLLGAAGGGFPGRGIPSLPGVFRHH